MRQILTLLAVVGAVMVGGCSSDPAVSQSGSAVAAQTSATQTAASEPAAADPVAEQPTSPGTVRYLSLGDSLTQGVGAPDEQTGAFPALLAQKWRDAGCDVELNNVGISGYTSAQILDEQVPAIESFAPTFITFQGGGNDLVYGVTLDEYRTNVAAILDAATASGAQVVVLAQNEWFRSPAGLGYANDDTPTQREAFDQALIDEASSRGAEFVDMRPIYAEQADQELWVEDGIHPTPEAYQVWAEELASALPAPCT